MGKIPVFGKKLNGIDYQPRSGAYGVIIDERGLLPVIYIHENFFLPGGGQEKGESIEECLKRELLEELGAAFNQAELIGRADEYFRSLDSGKYYRGQGHFFRIKGFHLAAEPTDKTHTIEWVEPGKALACLTHECQRWAVKRALDKVEMQSGGIYVEDPEIVRRLQPGHR